MSPPAIVPTTGINEPIPAPMSAHFPAFFRVPIIPWSVFPTNALYNPSPNPPFENPSMKS